MNQDREKKRLTSAMSPAQKPSVKVKALWVGVRYAGSGFEKRPGT